VVPRPPSPRLASRRGRGVLPHGPTREAAFRGEYMMMATPVGALSWKESTLPSSARPASSTWRPPGGARRSPAPAVRRTPTPSTPRA
jgi:hypothetical protein